MINNTLLMFYKFIFGLLSLLVTIGLGFELSSGEYSTESLKLVIVYISLILFTYGIWKQKSFYMIPMAIAAVVNFCIHFFNYIQHQSVGYIGLLIGASIGLIIYLGIYIQIRRHEKASINKGTHNKNNTNKEKEIEKNCLIKKTDYDREIMSELNEQGCKIRKYDTDEVILKKLPKSQKEFRSEILDLNDNLKICEDECLKSFNKKIKVYGLNWNGSNNYKIEVIVNKNKMTLKMEDKLNTSLRKYRPYFEVVINDKTLFSYEFNNKEVFKLFGHRYHELYNTLKPFYNEYKGLTSEQVEHIQLIGKNRIDMSDEEIIRLRELEKRRKK